MIADVLIVGGGLAGLRAAAAIRALTPDAEVVVCDAGGAASTEIMGFSSPVAPGDSVALMAQDTLKSGGGAADPALAAALAEGAVTERVTLEKLGLRFDRDASGHYDLVHAVGSSLPRVVHAGTNTGRLAMELYRCPVRTGRVVKLLTHSGRITGGPIACSRIAGARLQDGTTIRAKAVILAGGGFSGLWKRSTWSKQLRGDALLLACDAGVAWRDLRHVQYEPTVTLSGFSLITSCLGEGGVLRRSDGSVIAIGHPLPRKRELALRIEEETHRSGPVIYDLSGLDPALWETRYAGYAARYRAIAPDLRFEVRPAAHTTLGGIVIDDRGATAIPGLFAAGECTGGVHGRDRIGGDAGVEVLVFGQRAGEAAARYAATVSLPPLPQLSPLSERAKGPAVPDDPGLYRSIAAIFDRYINILERPADRAAARREIAKLPECSLTALAQQVCEA